MSIVVWAGVLLIAVWAAHWGAEHMAEPLKKLRTRWGLSGVAGGALVGIATASPEIAINIASALRGVSDIGLGAMLGANLIALPLTLAVGYVSYRTGANGGPPLRLERQTVSAQVLPYLAILALVGLLMLPTQWQGLQPMDGWVLLGAYGLYLAQALLRGRTAGEPVQWRRKEILLALAGLLVLALGAYLTVRATEQIVSALGISKLVGGLFITGTMSALPEAFSTWSVMRTEQRTAAVTTVLGDQVTTMTVAFLPLALVGLPLQDVRLFWVSLVALAIIAGAFGALIGLRRPGLNGWKVSTVTTLYVGYVAVVLVWVLGVI